MRTASQSSATESLTLTNAEFAQALGISTRHLYTMDQEGRIGPRAVRLGKRVLWSRSAIKDWLSAGAPDREIWQVMKEKPAGVGGRRGRSETT